MRRCCTIVLFFWFVMQLSAQSTSLHVDTIRMQDVVFNLTDDQLLLYMVERQGRELAAKEEAAYQERMRKDTTTAFPFHVGLRDSLRIAHYTEAMSHVNPLFMPLYFIPDDTPDLLFSTDTVPQRMMVLHNIRKYISTYRPDLYEGVYDPNVVIDIDTRPLRMHVSPIPIPKALVHDAEEDRLDRIRAVRLRYSYWYREATVMLQLTQNYVSKNWYAGGNTNFALLGIMQGKVIYNNRRNITWENTGEWRFGFNTVSADTLRKINTNEDIFKLYSKLGIRIVNKLNASFSAEFQTHFFNTWKENTKVLKTGPFTPARLNISAGLDYKPVHDLSLFFAPLTYRMIGVLDTIHVAQTTFSIPAGSKVLNEVGSSLRVEWNWHPVREIVLDTKFWLYTNYRRVEIDLEVSADFIINRFLSARIMLHPRYDNTVILPDDERAKMQFKELISVGFSHKFH